jgi:hypothetical protein
VGAQKDRFSESGSGLNVVFYYKENNILIQPSVLDSTSYIESKKKLRDWRNHVKVGKI